ncbi:histidine kinase [Emticicia sp. SJ17W-69]|uniref:sensor histidine kinase n=1 Tax=Emticicia sp. SJ17W-69 TaxID=3421657 RepID=UPI003EBD235B
MKYLINFLLFFVSFSGFAQHYPIIEYTVKEGLAQMQVTGVFEDSRGYIWAATKFGLSKFDGEKFENFYKQDSLKFVNFSNLTEDSKGNIWLTYDYRGYAKFDGKSFTNYTFTQTNSTNIVEHKGKMIFMRNDSLFSISKEKFIFEGITLDNKGAIPNFRSDNGILYAVIGSELYCFDEKKRKFVSIFQSEDKNAVIYLGKIRDNLLLKVNSGSTTHVYLLKNKQVVLCFSLSPTKTQFYYYPTFNFNFSFEGKTWIYDKIEKNIAKISDELSGYSSESNAKKESQKLYIGTERGLFCLFLNGFKYFTRSEVPYAWGVVEDHKKNIWISNFQVNLQKYDGKKLQTITQHEPIMAKVFKKNGYNYDKGSINSWYYSPLRDKYNKLWFPRFDGALMVEKGKFEYFSPKKDTVFFFNIAEDRQRNKIIGCGVGAFAIIDNKPPYHYKIISDTAQMFLQPRLIFSAAVDADGNYWLGGRNIVKYNPDKGSFKYYTNTNKKLMKLVNVNLTFDSRGGLWAGTFNDGLSKYNAKTDKFDAVFEKYLKDKQTVFLGQISEKYFAISDNLNIYIIDLDALYKSNEEKVVKVLNYHNGLVGIEPGQNGFFKDSEGKIWVCSGTVLSYFDPKLLNFQQVSLQTYIRKINGQRLPFQYEDMAPIELENNKNEVRLEVESVGEDKSANAQFSYRIKGFKEGWSEWQTDRTIYLTNMPAGVFTIEVRSRRNIWEGDKHPITHLKFKVNIPFWKSPDFYQYAFFGFLILLGGLGYIFNRSYSQNKKISQQKRLAEEQERQMNILQIQTTQAQLNPHFIFNVLVTLQSQINENQSQEASENIVKLSHLIRSFLSASAFDNKTISSIIKLEIILEKEIALLRSYIEFEKLQRDNFDYEIIEIPPVDSSNYKIQTMLIQPFVENAIKHGFNELQERGKLTITFSEIDDYLVCEIDDNGIGREKSRELQKKSIAKYKSLGTELVFNRIEVLRKIGYLIDIKIYDKIQGTKITMSIRFEGNENGKN